MYIIQVDLTNKLKNKIENSERLLQGTENYGNTKKIINTKLIEMVIFITYFVQVCMQQLQFKFNILIK